MKKTWHLPTVDCTAIIVAKGKTKRQHKLLTFLILNLRSPPLNVITIARMTMKMVVLQCLHFFILIVGHYHEIVCS